VCAGQRIDLLLETPVDTLSQIMRHINDTKLKEIGERFNIGESQANRRVTAKMGSESLKKLMEKAEGALGLSRAGHGDGAGHGDVVEKSTIFSSFSGVVDFSTTVYITIVGLSERGEISSIYPFFSSLHMCMSLVLRGFALPVQYATEMQNGR
jgi:hypothetical protein